MPVSVSGEVPPEARVAIAQAANDLLTIQNVEASFVAVQVGSGVNISARSLGAVNVQVIMESLGGGGHQTMAAAQLKHITPEAARARIQTAIDQYRESQKKPLSKNEPESRKNGEAGMNHYDYLIVGAGLYGAVFAQQAKKAGKTCLVIDKRSHIAGNIYTEEVEGIQVHRYGAHIFTHQQQGSVAVCEPVRGIQPLHQQPRCQLLTARSTICPSILNTFNNDVGVR